MNEKPKLNAYCHICHGGIPCIYDTDPECCKNDYLAGKFYPSGSRLVKGDSQGIINLSVPGSFDDPESIRIDDMVKDSE